MCILRIIVKTGKGAKLCPTSLHFGAKSSDLAKKRPKWPRAEHVFLASEPGGSI